MIQPLLLFIFVPVYYFIFCHLGNSSDTFLFVQTTHLHVVFVSTEGHIDSWARRMLLVNVNKSIFLDLHNLSNSSNDGNGLLLGNSSDGRWAEPWGYTDVHSVAPTIWLSSIEEIIHKTYKKLSVQSKNEKSSCTTFAFCRKKGKSAEVNGKHNLVQ